MPGPQRQRRPSGFAAFLPPLPPVESNPPRYEPRETSQVASRQEVFRAMMSQKNVSCRSAPFSAAAMALADRRRAAQALRCAAKGCGLPRLVWGPLTPVSSRPTLDLVAQQCASSAADPQRWWADRSFNYFSGRLLSTACVPGPIRGCTIRAAVDVVGQV